MGSANTSSGVPKTTRYWKRGVCVRPCTLLGDSVGWTVGLIVGDREGANEGGKDGSSVGSPVSSARLGVGFEVSSSGDAKVGAFVCSTVGLSDGAGAVGSYVSPLAIGDFVIGAAVGLLVGDAVGTDHDTRGLDPASVAAVGAEVDALKVGFNVGMVPGIAKPPVDAETGEGSELGSPMNTSVRRATGMMTVQITSTNTAAEIAVQGVKHNPDSFSSSSSPLDLSCKPSSPATDFRLLFSRSVAGEPRPESSEEAACLVEESLAWSSSADITDCLGMESGEEWMLVTDTLTNSPWPAWFRGATALV